MEDDNAAAFTALNSVQALGRGFDVNFDTRLLYCKGVAGSRIVEVDEENFWDMRLYDDLVVPNVSRDVKNTKGSAFRDSSGVCSFDETPRGVSLTSIHVNFHVLASITAQGASLTSKSVATRHQLVRPSSAEHGPCALEMVEYFNRKANLSGNVPLGSFNAAFSFTGSKNVDAAATKSLSMDGFFILLARVQLVRWPLVLKENVKKAIPASWDPPALARYECLQSCADL
ncbi:hypothetical protein Ancab_031422 [Ancistrocladus abbreviatus]